MVVLRGPAAALAGCVVAALCGSARASGEPQLSIVEPAPVGWQLGDVMERRIRVTLPEGAVLDTRSLPVPRRSGAALELRHVERLGQPEGAGVWLRLSYQVLRSPEAPTVFELPAMRWPVKLAAGRGERVLFIPAHGVMVAPLAPAEPPNLTGFGPLQADAPVPPLALDRWAAWRLGLGAWLVLAGAGLLVGRWAVRAGWGASSLWRRTWQDVADALGRDQSPDPRRLDAAERRLLGALNEAAGRALLPGDALAWASAQPMWQPHLAALQAFLQTSQTRWYAPEERLPSSAQRALTVRALAQALARDGRLAAATREGLPK